MWPAMLRLAARLGVTPEAFWRLSLTEWRALTGVGVGLGLNREEFERLIDQFPDGEGDEREL